MSDDPALPPLRPRRSGDLVLRAPTEADVPDVMVWRNRPEVARWLLRTTMTEAEVLGRFRERPVWTVPVAVEHGGRVVGTAFVDVLDGMGQDGGTEHLRSEGLVGYLFDPDVHGRGFATRTLEVLLEIAFADLGLRRVTAGCFADNIASWRVMEKAGMRREQHGVRDSWHAELGWVDGLTYGLLREEWAARGSG
ncbi:GNAT family protein [Arthrobacter sp. NEB 688]|uniref:GNAT family N-acetyltransferase n=1 Tax=Arthrobacter sp. NEB 688 TaxID=904039 RepID=UPI00256FAC31|nr:GNAT family protein [Arthrobacter sp. NEB 688]